MTRCIINPKKDFISKTIFYRWNEKIIQYYNVRIDFEVIITISPCPLNDMRLHIMNGWGELTCFLQPVICTCFIWTTPDKSFCRIILPNKDT